MRAVTEAGTIDKFDAEIERMVALEKKAGVAMWVRWSSVLKTHALRYFTRRKNQSVTCTTYCGKELSSDKQQSAWFGSASSGGKYCTACVRAVRREVGH